MSSSPLTFQNLPPELKCRIMDNLDVRSLLRLSSTSKSIYEVIYASEVFVLDIEMARSDLRPIMNIESTSMALRFLEAHVDARLNMPIATRPCVRVPAPEDVILKERLFRGFLACITDNDRLHIWDISDPDPAKVPLHMAISVPDLVDVFIAPGINLLVLLCYHSSDHDVTIMLVDFTSKDAHPWAISPLIRHTPLPDENFEYHDGEQLLSVCGELLAIIYHVDSTIGSRRGIVWNWITGEIIYDSKDFSSSSDLHDLLLLPQANYFLVTASTFLVDNPGAPLGAWIELRGRGSTTTPGTSRLIAQFSLPEFVDPEENCLGALEFHSSEPFPVWGRYQEDKFPFTSNRTTSVHVLNIWYISRRRAYDLTDRKVYLIISNTVFLHVLTKLFQQDNPIDATSSPIRIAWDEWSLWTTMWDYDKLGVLTASSSVCGSRICTLGRGFDGEVELCVIDFNMRIPCSQWGCTDPLAHSYPITISPNDSPWAQTVRTWLPFHTVSKRFRLQGEDDRDLVCNSVLIDEERIVLSTCVDEPTDLVMNPTSWKVVHLIREPTALGSNCFMPVTVMEDEPMEDEPMEDESMESSQWQHDKICRLCNEKPHTDAHILLECSANPSVVALRQGYSTRLGLQDPMVPPVDDLFKGLMARRGWSRLPVLMLMREISRIYNGLPECSEFVLADKENPASILFATKR